VTNTKISLTGNGRSDFIGYGAAIVARGETTRLVVDGARIVNTGVVRAGVVADAGSNVIVKNSYIQTNNGVLPSDYVPTIDYLSDCGRSPGCWPCRATSVPPTCSAPTPRQLHQLVHRL